jgi:hypothetical protein
VWWCTSVIPTLGRQKQEVQEFKASKKNISKGGK